MHQYLTGFIRDIMYELASVGDLPLPQSSPTPNHKRDRDDDDPKSAVPASEPLQPSSAEKPRHYAGTKRVIDTRKARQDQFRSALSSSLSTMHLNGSHNGMALDPGSRTSSESGAHDGNLTLRVAGRSWSCSRELELETDVAGLGTTCMYVDGNADQDEVSG